MKPDRMEQEEFAEAQLDGCIQLTRDSADIARSLRVAGYEVECRYDGWRLIDKRGNVRNLSDEELFEFSNGLARVPCSKCGVKLRAPAQKRLRLTCPRCGSVEAYST
jgi:ribosomal protein S27AE